MKTKIITFLVHFTAWIIFISLPYMFIPKPMMTHGIAISNGNIMFLRFLAFNCGLIGIFYLHGYWVMPKFLFKKKWVLYVCLLLSLFVIFLLLHESLFVRKPPMVMGKIHIRPGFKGEFELFRPERGNSVFLFIVIIIISGGIRIVEEWIKTEKKAKQIENDRMTMELSFLRSQINPHFLFNTLNNIYTLAVMKSDKAPDAVMKLSDIMRYITEDSNSNFVPLEKEVDYIKDYVELQKIRIGENIDIILNFSGDFIGVEIPPLILIPFVENAFKHGISSHKRAKIIIELKAQANSLEFRITNYVFQERIQKSSPGLGLKNTQQRLELLYPSRFSLDINDKHGIFSVCLKIRML